MTVRVDRSLLLTRVLFALLTGTAPGVIGACTSFDDAEASEGYLDFAGAAQVCARVFSCPGLATSLRRSIAAPIDGASFSTCMTWLAGPSPPPPGALLSTQRAALAQVAAATTCDAASVGLGVVPIAAYSPEPPCAEPDASGCTPAGDAFDCAQGQVTICKGPQFVVGSTCDASLTPARCASPPGCVVKSPTVAIGACPSALALCTDNATPQEEIACSVLGEGCVTDPMVPISGPGDRTIPLSLCTSTDNATPSICGGQTEGGATCSGGAVVLCNHLRSVVGPFGAEVLSYAAVETLYDCQGGLGWSCDPGAGATPFPFCARPGAACAPGDTGVDTCDGDVLLACIAGVSERIDCSSVGARCTPPAATGAGAFCAFGP